MKRMAVAVVLGLVLAGPGLAQELVVTPDPQAAGQEQLPQGAVEWGYYCARCHRDAEALGRQIAAKSGDRAALDTRRWLGVFLSRHHAPTPEIAVALAAWLAPDPE